MSSPLSLSSFDVVIAGGGPVGLFLACELRLRGVAVLVLEQAVESAALLKRLPFGLRGLSVPTLEAFDRRGLLEEIITPDRAATDRGASNFAPTAHWTHQARQPGGHFAGMQFFHDMIDTSQWPYRLPGQANHSLAATMERIETVLALQAEALGVDIRRGVGVELFDQSEDSVTVQAGGQRLGAHWLIGCDGGRSTVRKAAGFTFTGTDPEFTGYSVEVELADPEQLQPGRHFTSTGMYTFARPGTIAMVDFDGGAYDRNQPLTLDYAQAVLRRISGIDVTLTALRLGTTWTDRALQATTYRRGRVMLAGDAAHIHSPLGGQGLNLGLGDAMNLGWKLAAVIHGTAPAGLLDSYTAERHPVGAQILDWSRAQVALMRAEPGTRALAPIIRDLISMRDGATYFASRIWGVSMRYDLGEGHPLVGRSASEFEMADGMRLAALMRSGQGLLLDFDTRAPLRELASRWGRQVRYVADDARDRLGLSAVLVRPDGIVAWACDGTPDPEEIAVAAARWFSH